LAIEEELALGSQMGNTTMLDHAYLYLFYEMYESIYTPFVASEDYQEMKLMLRKKYNNVQPEDFEYIGVLGKGGFGIVAEVLKKSTGIKYAMKIQSKQVLSDSFGDEPWRACLEMQAFATCKHPFIVELSYAFQTKALVVLVMSSNNGRDLELLLQYGGCFSHEQVRFYSAQISSALNYLHDKCFVYRDLKASNVVLNADGHIQLIDFGSVCDLKGNTLGWFCV
jgi:atypical protein kinase C iota type